MRRLICYMRGHRYVNANSKYPMVIPDGPGLVLVWERAPARELGNGVGCLRCGRFCATKSPEL
jgi:hypothetical protein